MPDLRPRGATLGAPTEFQPNVYKTKLLSYPLDLHSEEKNEYGGNYVVFYINVHKDSKLIADNKATPVDPSVGNVPRGLQGDLAGQKVSSATLYAAGGAAGAAAASAADLSNRVTGTVGVKLDKTVASGADIVLGGAAGAAVVKMAGGSVAEYKRIDQAISLYVPTELSVNYSMDWRAEDMALSSAIFTVLDSAPKLVEAAKNGSGIAGVLDEIKKGAGAGANYLAGRALSTPVVGEAISKLTGTAANPKKEQLFKSVNFREFTFSYQFFPKDVSEANAVKDIIQTFKLHMHPEYKDGSGFLYTYPSEFDIFYYVNNKENLNLHRHTSCVLTDMTVSYTPQGIFTTFPDGMPNQINVQLRFRELALLSKENIEDGY